jgi:hypothetical protein
MIVELNSKAGGTSSANVGGKMTAKLTKIEKRTIGGTLMVVSNVDFVDGSGKVVHSQEYGQLPEDVDPEYYQRQADVMQANIDLTERWKIEKEEVAEKEAGADDAINRVKHHLAFEESVEVKEGIQNGK